MFIKTSVRKRNGKEYSTEYLVHAYRDKKTGKPKQETILCLSKLPTNCILAVKSALHGDSRMPTSSLESLKVIATKEYGTVKVMGDIFDASFGKTFASLSSPPSLRYARAIKAIVLNKIFESKSKYSLPNWVSRQDFGFEISNKNDYYESLDYIEEHQLAIEKKLLDGKRKTKNVDILLYDITSTYFEGKGAENLCKYGYSRDHRGDRVQVNIGLVTDETGLPLSVEIFEGNIADKSTIQDKLKNLKEQFNIENITFIFDRGMKSKANLQAIEESGYGYITALSHSELHQKAKENETIQLSIFDKKDLAEFEMTDPETKKTKKYILCHNPPKKIKDTLDRMKLIEKTEKSLKSIQDLKKTYSDIDLQDKVSKKVNAFKCEKYLIYTIQNGKLTFERNVKKIEEDELFDGFYMIETTDIKLTGNEAEKKYKDLQLVERAFDAVKNIIEIRPVFHYKETRIKGHIFTAFMSYYVLHIFKEKCSTLLKEHTLDNLLTELRTIQKTYFEIEKYHFEKLNELSETQKEIFNIFHIKHTL